MTASVLAYIPSPSQGVWHLGPVPLRAYALCIIVGIVAALIIGDRRWAERGGERGVIYDIALWAVPFGLIGGRLYHVMTDWRTYFGDDGAGFVAAFKIWDGGLGIWGAVALGGVGAWIGCRQRGIPLPAFGDAIAPGIVLAQAIGRLGNYFNQELYGRPTTLPWGLEIFERRNTAGALDSLNGVSTGQLVEVVHPTFLYELLWNVLVFAVLIWVDRRYKIGHGRLFALYVAAYCVGRFWVELMRSDMATHIAGIRVNTFTSTFVFIAAVVYIMVAPKGREDPATLRGNAVDDEDSPVDELGEDLIAVAATSGVVAAAKVAGDEDKPTTGRASGGPDAVEPVAAAPEVHAALAEDAASEADFGDAEAAEAEPEAEVEVEATSGAKSEPEAEAEVEGEPEAGPEAEPEPEAEVTDEPEAEVDAEPEAEAEVEGEPEAGPEAEPAPEAEAEPEEGLGPVDGDELAEVHDDASEVLAAEVEATAAAEAVAAEPEVEAVGREAVASEAAAEAEDLTEQVATAPSEDIAEAEAFAAAGAAADAEPEPGLGSVEGDEAVEAETAAAEVHEAAVDAAEDAGALAEDVAAEAEEDAEPEVEAAAEPEPEPEPEPEAEAALASEPESEPKPGSESVEGDEVVEAQEGAAEVQETATEGAADIAAEAASPEPEPEPEAEPEDGLGSVERDEVVEAQEGAAEVHEAAAEGADEAEALAEDVAAGAASAEPEPEPEPEDGLGSVEGDEVVEAQEAAAEGAADVAAEAASAEPEAEDGLGSVEGDEVVEAQEGAAEVHEAAAEGADEAEALAADVAAEAASAEPEPEPEPEAEPEDGLGSVEGDEVVEAQEDAAEVQETATEGADEAEDVAAQPKTAEPKIPAAAPVATQREPESRRKRWWQRRG